MLNSVPVLLQAIVWLYLGAAILLVVGRLLPNWIRRLVAMVFALASVAALRSLVVSAAGIEPIGIFWAPLNLFRMGPTLYPDSLALLGGLTLAGVTAALVLGIRGAEPKRTVWHGLILAVLAGSLVTMMAANLLTLALGSALIDLALLVMALTAVSEADLGLWRVAVPGVISTLLLFLSALRMDTQVGTASLLARTLPEGVLLLVGLAGLFRLLVFPLHPRRLDAPENAATLILPAGVGIYLLARVKSLPGAASLVVGPILVDQSWVWVIAASALAAGGLLVWSASAGAKKEQSPGGTGVLPGLIVQQAGCALAFVLFVSASLPLALISSSLIVGILAIWWDGNQEKPAAPRPGWVEWLLQWTRRTADRVWTAIVERFPRLEQWRDGWLVRRGVALLPALALLAAVGAPLTLGFRVRWPFYAALLGEGRASQLLVVLLADTLLAAGLFVAIGAILRRGSERRPKPAAILAIFILAVPLVVLGIAPGLLSANLDLEPVVLPDVSVWGLGLIYLLPWLLGAWISRFGDRLGRYLAVLRQIVTLDWLYRAAGWVGQRLIDAVYWLGLVGEGEGWWGWALIVLALAAIFLVVR